MADYHVIDADGHINEPHDLWETYLEPQFRDRAIRFGLDPDGRERLHIAGKPSRYFNADILARGRSMGLSFEEFRRVNKYGAVIATPIFSSHDRLIGCVSLDVPGPAFQKVWRVPVRRVLRDAAQTIGNLVELARE